MSEISVKGQINAPADQVWETLSKFDGVEDWIASVESTEVEGSGEGATRVLTTKNGAKIHERLESLDPENRILNYSILESPLPFENYNSDMQVREVNDNRSEIEWSATFDPTVASEEECKKILNGIYQMGMEGLNNLHGSLTKDVEV